MNSTAANHVAQAGGEGVFTVYTNTCILFMIWSSASMKEMREVAQSKACALQCSYRTDVMDMQFELVNCSSESYHCLVEFS